MGAAGSDCMPPIWRPPEILPRHPHSRESNLVGVAQTIAMPIVDLAIHLVRLALIERAAQKEQPKETKAEASQAGCQACTFPNEAVLAPDSSIGDTCWRVRAYCAPSFWRVYLPGGGSEDWSGAGMCVTVVVVTGLGGKGFCASTGIASAKTISDARGAEGTMTSGSLAVTGISGSLAATGISGSTTMAGSAAATEDVTGVGSLIVMVTAIQTLSMRLKTLRWGSDAGAVRGVRVTSQLPGRSKTSAK